MTIRGKLSNLFNPNELETLNLNSLNHLPILVEGKPIGTIIGYNIDRDTFTGIIFDKCISKEICVSNMKDIFCFNLAAMASQETLDQSCFSAGVKSKKLGNSK